MSQPASDSAGIRGTFVVPNWLSNRLGKNVGFRILWSIALLCDIFVQAMLEAFRGALPGIGDASGLYWVGLSRGLAQGHAEPNATYASRLRNWLTLWLDSGKARGLAGRISEYIGPGTVVRVVDRGGLFVTANGDGTYTATTDTNWNWDSGNISWSGYQHGWSDIWIIVYVTDPTSRFFATYSSLTDPTWVAQWGLGGTTSPGSAGLQLGTGHQVTRQDRNAILNIIAQWKGAHCYVATVIFSTDPNIFVPGNLLIAGNPDGSWGAWAFGVTLPSPARAQTTAHGVVRYWTPELIP